MLSNVLLMTGNDGESMLLLRCFVALGMVGSVVFWTGKKEMHPRNFQYEFCSWFDDG